MSEFDIAKLPPRLRGAWYNGPSVRVWLVIAAALGFVVAFLSPPQWGSVVRGIAAWDVAVIFWFAVVAGLLSQASPHELAQRAVRYNLGWIVILAIVSTAVMASLGAIVQLLAEVKNLPLPAKAPHLIASVVTISLSWAALHLLYTFHYTHQYYARINSGIGEEIGGMEFPGTPAPTFGDFFYFSITVGATSQTSDVVISSPAIRRSVTIHALLSFAFNTAVLAVTINIAAGVV